MSPRPAVRFTLMRSISSLRLQTSVPVGGRALLPRRAPPPAARIGSSPTRSGPLDPPRATAHSPRRRRATPRSVIRDQRRRDTPRSKQRPRFHPSRGRPVGLVRAGRLGRGAPSRPSAHRHGRDSPVRLVLALRRLGNDLTRRSIRPDGLEVAAEDAVHDLGVDEQDPRPIGGPHRVGRELRHETRAVTLVLARTDGR